MRVAIIFLVSPIGWFLWEFPPKIPPQTIPSANRSGHLAPELLRYRAKLAIGFDSSLRCGIHRNERPSSDFTPIRPPSPQPSMARKVINRAEKAAEAEAVEKALASKKKKSSKRSKAAENVRMRLYWGVFSQNLKRVAVFDFDKKSEADKRAKELSKGGKSPHFVQKVKEPIAVE